MIKILYLSFHPEIGGGETSLLSLLSKLDRKKFEATVVLPNAGQLQKEISKLNIKTIILPLPGYLLKTLFIPGMSPKYFFRFHKLVKKVKPDIIHTNHLNLVVYAGISAKILKIPTVATAHGSWDSVYFFQDFITNIFTDKILANTLQTANTLKKRKIINADKIQTITFGIDTDYFHPKDKNTAKKFLKFSPNDLIFTVVGRLDPVKDHLTFLLAANIVSQKIKSVRFLIVGSTKGDFTGQNNDYQTQIDHFLKLNPKLSKKIIFHGFSSNMPLIYGASDILVSSSLSESFGLALAEASACAVPVICTNIGGQSNIIINGKSGFLVPPQKPTILATKMLVLAKKPRLRQKFGENGRKHIESNFSLDRYVKEVQNAYLSVINKTK